jgi:hypothetical protein
MTTITQVTTVLTAMSIRLTKKKSTITPTDFKSVLDTAKGDRG